MQRQVWPAYFLDKPLAQMKRFCVEREPDEALAALIGYRCQFEGRRYVKVVDWATGEHDASPVHAQFTRRGLSEYRNFLDERYGAEGRGPKVVGLIHSHPFDEDPVFSDVDRSTFLSLPFDAEGNVFAIVGSGGRRVNVFVVTAPESGAKTVAPADWVEYRVEGVTQAESADGALPTGGGPSGDCGAGR